MTGYVEADEAMAQLFNDIWTPTGHAYTLGNEVFTAPDRTPWARMITRINAATQSTLGRPGSRKFDRFGSVLVQVFTPTGDGTRVSSELVQTVVDGFEGARISGTTICFNDVIPRAVGPSDKWYQVTIEAEFRYTATK